MRSLQKYAWFNLSVTGATILVTVAAVAGIGYSAGWDKARAGLGLLGFLGILGFGGYFLRQNKQSAQPALDEREREILAKATATGFGLFWVVFVLASIGAWAALGAGGCIPVEWLPLGVVGGMLIHKLGESLYILWRYGR